MCTIRYFIAHSRLLCLALSNMLFAAAAHGQQADAGSATLEEVVVLGRGETRQVQSITSQQIDRLPAGTSPLKAIETLPGVNFQAADAYGAYEWAATISVRGFNQNRLGYTLDSVPLGDMTYGNHNGLHISRAIPSENVAKASLSQGAGDLATASSNNLGGTVEFISAAPLDAFGAEFAQMIGSDSARRSYVRVDTGELAAGLRAYLSAVDASTEKWKGAGDQQQRMYNLKLVQPIGAATLTGYYNYSDRVEIDYQDLSKDIVARRGWDWDNWYPDWSAAVGAAQACSASGQDDPVVCDDAYWGASGVRKDHLGYVALELPFGDAITWKATAYAHQDEGQGLWGTPYVPTPGGAPLSVRTTEYDLARQGVVTALTWEVGRHTINLGAWYEMNDFTQARRFYGEPSTARAMRSLEEFQRNPFRTDWEYDFETETTTFHLQDTWSLTDRMELNLGFRSVKVENSAATIVGPMKTGTIESDEPLLPQIGVNWSLSDQFELFASAAKNVRAFASSGTSGGPFSQSAEAFAATKDILEPETSTNYEAGLRFRSGNVETSFAAYRIDFEDRLLGIPQCVGIVGCFSVIANVGSVKTNGVEAALSWRPLSSVTWFTSAAWNESEFDDDYIKTTADSSSLVPVSGKRVPDAPEILLKSELAYDNGRLFARLDVNYTDERFYTYLNDASVGAYTLLNAGIGVRFAPIGVVEEIVLQADLTNLTDKRYFSTIGTNGLDESDSDGNLQTLLRGAPRQGFLSVKARF